MGLEVIVNEFSMLLRGTWKTHSTKHFLKQGKIQSKNTKEQSERKREI